MATNHHDAGASTSAHCAPTQQDLIVTIIGARRVSFTGTRAQIEAEGLLSDAFRWPSGGRLYWSSGWFEFKLTRERPPGQSKRNPEVDWWTLQRDCRDCRQLAAQDLQRATDNLADALFALTPEGQAADAASEGLLSSAGADRSFQALLADMVPPTPRATTPLNSGEAA